MVKEAGCGLNDNRRRLEQLLEADDFNILIFEHKDRLASGNKYIQMLLIRVGIDLEIANLAEGTDELMQDLMAIITILSARLYGDQVKHKTEKIIAELTSNGNNNE